MTAAEILALAYMRDIVLEVQGDRLVVDAPTGAVTPEFRAELVRHKPALMAMLAPAFVTLTHGPTVPVVALALALDLEDRGFRLLLDDAGEAVIEPATRLTDADRAAIGRWRRHLGAIAAYTADTDGAPSGRRPADWL